METRISENLSMVVCGVFAADNVSDELEQLGSAVLDNQDLYMDDQGGLHTSAQLAGSNRVVSTNMTKVNTDPFAAAQNLNDYVNVPLAVDEYGNPITEDTDEVFDQEEDNNNRDFVDDSNNDSAQDQEGDLVLDTEGEISSSDDNSDQSVSGDNLTRVKSDPFAAQTDGAPEEQERISREVRESLFGADPTVQTDNVPVGSFEFDEEPQGSSSNHQLDMDQEGNVSANEPDSRDENGNPVIGTNMSRVQGKPFAAGVPRPSDPTQWYNKNEVLFNAEINSMKMKHPQAFYGFLKTTGNMYWIIQLKVADSVKPWTFLLEYQKDHPHNTGYGGSVKVQLLKSPSLAELRQRARDYGRKGVPHIVKDRRSNGEEYEFLCTRFPKDILSGKDSITSATMVAGWAADWALHFEVGLRNKDVWNKWCDDSHFRHLKVD